jgi:hypothetical protein
MFEALSLANCALWMTVGCWAARRKRWPLWGVVLSTVGSAFPPVLIAVVQAGRAPWPSAAAWGIRLVAAAAVIAVGMFLADWPPLQTNTTWRAVTLVPLWVLSSDAIGEANGQVQTVSGVLIKPPTTFRAPFVMAGIGAALGVMSFRGQC